MAGPPFRTPLGWVPFDRPSYLSAGERISREEEFNWLLDLRRVSVTFVLYIRAWLWSGEMYVEDLDLSKDRGDSEGLVTQPEDLVLVRE